MRHCKSVCPKKLDLYNLYIKFLCTKKWDILNLYVLINRIFKFYTSHKMVPIPIKWDKLNSYVPKNWFICKFIY